MRNVLTAALVSLGLALPAFAQTPPLVPMTITPAAPAPLTMEVLTLDQAIERALKSNPTVAQATQGILRAESLLQQARGAALPNVNVTFINTFVNTERRFEDTVTQPQNQANIGLTASLPFLAPSRWAATAQAGDQVEIAKISTADVGRNVAIATAQAYLAILAQKRQIDVSMRARETSLAHLDYARRRLEAGAGTRVNELRAAQELSTTEAILENAQFAVHSAQEALGVLIASTGPVDAAAEPVFDLSGTIDEPTWMTARPDIRLFTASERAADKVWQDSKWDWFPTGIVAFDPQALFPASAFTTARSWRIIATINQPLFDGGSRRGEKRFRESQANASRLALTGLQIQARSEVRLAQEAVRSTERALKSLQAAAQQADEVLRITTFAFEAGATTNLEVIDAQRQARDAESSAAIAQDVLQRARLDLLAALGRFPQ